MTAFGVIAFRYLDQKAQPVTPVVQAVPSIVTVQVPVPGPAMPPPAVNVTVQPPAPPEPPVAITPPARALTPFLNADCIARTDNTGEVSGGQVINTRACSWDDGFPAISGDGKTIVLKYSADDGGRGWLDVAVRFIDVETSKVLSDHSIVVPEELDEQGQSTDKSLALARKRIAPIQKRLDAGNYRTMRVIQNAIPEVDGEAPAGLRIEYAAWDPMARVVDGDANTVVWRGEFDVTKEYPTKKVVTDEDIESCYPTSTNDVYAWFDPTTRSIAFQVSYGSGPCYCSSTIHHYVRRAATP